MTLEQINGNAVEFSVPRTAVESGNRGFVDALANAAQAEERDVAMRLAASPSASVSSRGPVKIGTITSKNPTVSNLLIGNSALKKDCWNIIYAEQNRDKAYTRIPAGTDIYYDPSTRELLWGDMMEKRMGGTTTAPPAEMSETLAPVETAAPPVSGGTEAGGDALSGNLVDAVRSMIGKTYSDVNCYELVVSGLDKMGIRYYGRDGLGNRMITGALENGLPENAYLNGEGLIQYSGSESYRKAFMRVSDPEAQAKEVMAEMAGYLESGSILAFSTESRGHTGVVSNRDGAWTYINSGNMDHPVNTAATSKGVGEESLAREIEDWFRLAAGKDESLVITVGKLNSSKLAAYGGGIAQRV